MSSSKDHDAFAAAALARFASTTAPAITADPEEVVEEVRRNLAANLAACAPKNCGITKNCHEPK